MTTFKVATKSSEKSERQFSAQAKLPGKAFRNKLNTTSDMDFMAEIRDPIYQVFSQYMSAVANEIFWQIELSVYD